MFILVLLLVTHVHTTNKYLRILILVFVTRVHTAKIPVHVILRPYPVN
jgi:hypothetical protein